MRQQPTRAAILAAAAILVLIALFVLVGPAAHWLASYDNDGHPTPEQIDAARGRIFQVTTAILAIGALWYTARNHRISQGNHRLSLEQYKLAERGQVTERFGLAIEQLGSSSEDIRIGAIYILERIARDSAADHPAVMEVLCSFVRRRTVEMVYEDNESKDEGISPEPDVQAALTIIARRDTAQDRRPVNLEGANLAGAHLKGANLKSANLICSDLRKAHLQGANLQGARFFKANLSYTYLHDANVSRADLRWANMEHVWANRTDFRNARFWGADLRRADLHNADLRKADLSRKEVPMVTPPGADYSMTHLKGPFPEGWEVSRYNFPAVKMNGAILLGAQLQEADLHGVEGLTRDQIAATADHTGAHLPDYLAGG
jgi:uncharacterized protein YjbI with pentapeptide repeats